VTACMDCKQKPAVARKRCTGCYATWRRLQPGRCRYCGGTVSPERPASNGRTHDSCLERRRQLWHTYRLRIVEGYGGRCSCCGLADERFLTIDHVNNNGNQHRRELGGGNRRIFIEILKRGFPPDFQLLCFNCNCAKSTNGGVCPHEADRRAALSDDIYDAVTGNG
jgi:hypothetical protein